METIDNTDEIEQTQFIPKLIYYAIKVYIIYPFLNYQNNTCTSYKMSIRKHDQLVDINKSDFLYNAMVNFTTSLTHLL